ncbi:MAG: ribosome small subunit-dependent GTPase A [Actinomycetota bacterium]|nr:ribosome small subunit-dependent GTPase A [Actinomycetota bacterium]
MTGAGDMRDTLARLGYSQRVEDLFGSMRDDGFFPARVVRVDRGMPLVTSDSGTERVEVAVHLMRTTGAGSRVVVGDWVAIARPPGHDLPLIEAILPRSSAFTRKDPGGQAEEQVVAANIDAVFIVQSLVPDGPNLRRLERELVLSWESGARPVVVLTKADLCRDAGPAREAVRAIAHGVDVHVVSGVTREGVDALMAYADGDATIALLGASGVGKSTLVNAMVGKDVQATAEVRVADGKGRHTTVAREIVLMPGSGVLVDTPGMRALALWDSEQGLAAAFSDIARLAEECRFRDCTHVTEPGCAVTAAVDGGDLHGLRLESYHRLRDELDQLAVHREARARKSEAQTKRGRTKRGRD